MEPRQQDVLQRYYQRLSDNLEPKDLLKRLVIVGAIQSEQVDTVLEKWAFERQERKTNAQWLLESLRNHEQGMKYLIQGLLLSEIQDFLAREIIEDETFQENDVTDLLETLRDHLNEVQILKLELLKERKNHDETRRQLDEVKSNRTSAVFSDYDSSCCSGYDSSDVTSLLKDLEEEKKKREAAEKRTDELVESHQHILRHFKSLEDLSSNQSLKNNLPWKAASLADLCWPEESSARFHSGKNVTKWPSIDSGAQMKECSSNRNSFVDDETTGVLALAERVSLLETQLEKEINKRHEAECEITKLETENSNLHDELFDTRDQLFDTRDQLFAASQLDLREDDYKEQIWDEEDYIEQATTDSLSLYDEFSLGRRASCPSLNQRLSNQIDDVQLRHRPKRHMSRPVSYHGDTRVAYVWQNRNAEHYEMDQYENEIKNKIDPRDKDFRFALRRLKLDTWKLYNDVLINGAMIKSTTDRVKKIAIN